MTPVDFKRTEPIGFDKSLGLCFGWLCFSKKNGEPYVDAHGDHFPDDELLKAVDGLMAKPAAEREINVEHAGAGRGCIATAQALTEDVAKALGVDTGGTYGVIGSFRPDGELLKSIESGDLYCLSIEGRAYDVEQVAKAAPDAAGAPPKHKRTMRRVELTKLAVVKAGAHVGAEVALIKSAAEALLKEQWTTAYVNDLPDSAFLHVEPGGEKDDEGKTTPRSLRKFPYKDSSGAVDLAHLRNALARIPDSDLSSDLKDTLTGRARKILSKVDKSLDGVVVERRVPAFTSIDEGHQHAIEDIEDIDGCTSWETSEGEQYGHAHNWIRQPDGTIAIGVSDGHTHTLLTETESDIMSTAADIAKAQADLTTARAELAKSQARTSALAALLVAACSLPAEQAAFAKTLAGEALEAFIAQPEAERAARAKPVYVSKSTGIAYYNAETAEVAKMYDAQGVELAKMREQNEALEFAKAADLEIPHLKGTATERGALLKIVKSLPEDAQKAVLESLKSASNVLKSYTERVGHNGHEIAAGAGPEAELDALAKQIAASEKVTYPVAYSKALDTDRGRALYAQIPVRRA